ncbi:MAG: hypothetical protein EYX74_06755 [Desulfobulbaceae bacterium]|nr:MAG: hypothetical protein EYX74_06755 [Desulfobulbaceae bacterium]
MQDIQGQADHRQINIKKVGIKNISYPITVRDRARRIQRTVATVNMYVNLPHHFKGTHMSRFVEILNRFHGEINLESVHHILRKMKEHLQAQAAHLEIEFPYFVAESVGHDSAQFGPTQISSAKDGPPKIVGIGVCEYHCRMHGSLTDKDDLTLDVRIPIAPPRISDHCPGLPRSLGHWGTANISLRFRRFVWIEEIIELAARVTRHDLCWPSPQAITGHSSERKQNQHLRKPSLTVESMARALGQELRAHPDIRWFSVRVENLATGFATFATVNGASNNTRDDVKP